MQEFEDFSQRWDVMLFLQKLIDDKICLKLNDIIWFWHQREETISEGNLVETKKTINISFYKSSCTCSLLNRYHAIVYLIHTHSVSISFLFLDQRAIIT